MVLVDDPTLLNGERLQKAADALEHGQPVLVLLRHRMPPYSYYKWLRQILYERGHSDETTAVLACGCVISFEAEV